MLIDDLRDDVESWLSLIDSLIFNLPNFKLSLFVTWHQNVDRSHTHLQGNGAAGNKLRISPPNQTAIQPLSLRSSARPRRQIIHYLPQKKYRLNRYGSRDRSMDVESWLFDLKNACRTLAVARN